MYARQDRKVTTKGLILQQEQADTSPFKLLQCISHFPAKAEKITLMKGLTMLGAAYSANNHHAQHARRQRFITTPYQHVIRDLLQLKAATGIKIKTCKSRVFDEEIGNNPLNEQTAHEAIKQSYRVFKKGCLPVNKKEFIKTFGQLLGLEETEIESMLDRYFQNGGYCTNKGPQSVLHLMTHLYVAKQTRPAPSAPPLQVAFLPPSAPPFPEAGFVGFSAEEPLPVAVPVEHIDIPIAVPFVEAEVIASWRPQPIQTVTPAPGPRERESKSVVGPGFRIDIRRPKPSATSAVVDLIAGMLVVEELLETPPDIVVKPWHTTYPYIQEKKPKEEDPVFNMPKQNTETAPPEALVVLLHFWFQRDLYDKALQKLEEELFHKTHLQVN